jgi:hypothetical protein
MRGDDRRGGRGGSGMTPWSRSLVPRLSPGTDFPGPADALLAGLAANFSGELAVGAPLVHRAISGFGGEMTTAAELSLLPLAYAGALQLWDDRAADALASRYVRLAHAEEWHLHNVCAKLGITSRRQLRDALPDAAKAMRLRRPCG